MMHDVWMALAVPVIRRRNTVPNCLNTRARLNRAQPLLHLAGTARFQMLRRCCDVHAHSFCRPLSAQRPARTEPRRSESRNCKRGRVL